MAEVVCIKTFHNKFEAEVAKALLKANGIQVLLRADDEGGMNPLLVLLGPGLVRLYVKQNDVKKAVKILPS